MTAISLIQISCLYAGTMLGVKKHDFNSSIIEKISKRSHFETDCAVNIVVARFWGSGALFSVLQIKVLAHRVGYSNALGK